MSGYPSAFATALLVFVLVCIPLSAVSQDRSAYSLTQGYMPQGKFLQPPQIMRLIWLQFPSGKPHWNQ